MSIDDPAHMVVPSRKPAVTSSKYGLLPPPSGKFSGEVDGLVTSHFPLGCGTRKSLKNCTAPSMIGYASFKKALSIVYW